MASTRLATPGRDVSMSRASPCAIQTTSSGANERQTGSRTADLCSGSKHFATIGSATGLELPERRHRRILALEHARHLVVRVRPVWREAEHAVWDRAGDAVISER